MGLPVKNFIAANNINKVVYNYLNTGLFEPKASVATIANAMDVGDPSNFARIVDLYQNDYNAIVEDITGTTFSDEQIRETIAEVYTSLGYLLDPHGAVGYRALKEKLQPDQNGIFLETAHPAKFTETMESIIGKGNIPLPGKLQEFMKGEKRTIPISSDYAKFKSYLDNLK
jgi:threonine synthase